MVKRQKIVIYLLNCTKTNKKIKKLHEFLNVIFLSGIKPAEWNCAGIGLILFFCFLYKIFIYEGWNFNSGNYLFTTDTK